MRVILSQMLAALLLVQSVWAGEPVPIKTDWSGFQQQVAQLKLNNRRARISTTTGETLGVFFVRASSDGLIVRVTPKTRRWTISKTEALAPRSSVVSVEFSGRIGKGGLIGGLAGLGAGSAVAAGWASQAGGNCEGSACGGALLIIPVLALAGYYIGRHANARAPSFVIEP